MDTDLETLLRQNERIDSPDSAEDIDKPQKADKNATLDDFIAMVNKIVTKTMRDVTFKQDEGTRITVDPELKLDKPCITHEVVDRTPLLEIKPRERESFTELDDKGNPTGRFGTVYGQIHKCVIQFNIFAAEYSTANAVMNDFESRMFSYTHFFKKNGVRELYFKRHFTDYNYNIFRQSLSVRNLTYYVELEKLNVVYDGEILDVILKD